MRDDREIAFLLGKGLKNPDRKLAAAELIGLLLHGSPTGEELDAVEARIARMAGKAPLAAYRELRQALGYG